MKGTLYIQRKKGRQIDKPEALECEIDLRRGDIAIAGVGSTVKAMLHRAEVEFISANGLKVRGVEEAGFGLVSTLSRVVVYPHSGTKLEGIGGKRHDKRLLRGWWLPMGRGPNVLYVL